MSIEAEKTVPCLVPFGKMILSEMSSHFLKTERNSLFQGLLIGASVLPGLRGCSLSGSLESKSPAFLSMRAKVKSEPPPASTMPALVACGSRVTMTAHGITFRQAVEAWRDVREEFSDQDLGALCKD